MMHIHTLKTSRFVLGITASVLGVGWGVAQDAHAVPVSAGASASISGTTTAARPELAGTVLIDRTHEFTMTAASGAIIKGTVQERVAKRTASGTLEFSFRIKNSADSKGSIVLVSRTNYSAFPVLDMDFNVDGLGTVGAKSASFLSDAMGTAQFDFNNGPIKPGAESRFHFIGTRATSYEEKGLLTLRGDNGSATRFKVFSPVFRTQTPNRRLPNLITRIVGPATAKRGEDISNKIKVVATNLGTAPAPGTTGTLSPANGYMIDVILSSDRNLPTGYATYSPSYSEDVLLLGGRVSNTKDLAPSGSESYAAGATIPRNTRPGRYFLAVRIDPGDKVTESNEDDNTYFLPIQIF